MFGYLLKAEIKGQFCTSGIVASQMHLTDLVQQFSIRPFFLQGADIFKQGTVGVAACHGRIALYDGFLG